MHINDVGSVSFGAGVRISSCRAFVGGGIWWRYMGGNITDACHTCVFSGNTSKCSDAVLHGLWHYCNTGIA